MTLSDYTKDLKQVYLVRKDISRRATGTEEKQRRQEHSDFQGFRFYKQEKIQLLLFYIITHNSTNISLEECKQLSVSYGKENHNCTRKL